jgi:hypothetical protein
VDIMLIAGLWLDGPVWDHSGRPAGSPFPGWGEFEGPDSADLDDAAKC